MICSIDRYAVEPRTSKQYGASMYIPPFQRGVGGFIGSLLLEMN